MPKIKINDISMYYEIHGSGEPLVLIGGFSADHTIWSTVIDQFAEYFQVIVFDNRGAGRTDVPTGPYSIPQMTHDVVNLCQQLKISKANFVGNSMGGFIIQQLAHDFPELVKTATISNSTANIECCFHLYVSAQLELIKANAPIASLIKASCSWGFSYHYLSMPGALDALMKFGLENPFPFTVPGYEGQYAALDSFNSTTWLKNISVPTLVVGADQDLIFNETSIKFLAENIPYARYFSFKPCGHLPFIEYPEKFVEIVKEFINSVS